MQLTAVLLPAQEGGFVAMNPETGTTTQGETLDEALVNLQEATELYLEEFSVQQYGKPLITTIDVKPHAAWLSASFRERSD
jgi:predicted RNase H-like HicB family nuclease